MLDKKVVAILLVAGIFASMATFSFYLASKASEFTATKTSQTVSGFFSADVVDLSGNSTPADDTTTDETIVHAGLN